MQRRVFFLHDSYISFLNPLSIPLAVGAGFLERARYTRRAESYGKSTREVEYAWFSQPTFFLPNVRSETRSRIVMLKIAPLPLAVVNINPSRLRGALVYLFTLHSPLFSRVDGKANRWTASTILLLPSLFLRTLQCQKSHPKPSHLFVPISTTSQSPFRECYPVLARHWFYL